MLIPGVRTTGSSFNIPLKINEALIHGFEKKMRDLKIDMKAAERIKHETLKVVPGQNKWVRSNLFIVFPY